jgi:hypothetical protein
MCILTAALVLEEGNCSVSSNVLGTEKEKPKEKERTTEKEQGISLPNEYVETF